MAEQWIIHLEAFILCGIRPYSGEVMVFPLYGRAPQTKYLFQSGGSIIVLGSIEGEVQEIHRVAIQCRQYDGQIQNGSWRRHV